jgi:periplasmic divalent cation tolerance protein
MSPPNLMCYDKNMTDRIFIYVACGDIKEARKIAGHCVTERLAACGNILHSMESVYWWDGQINSEQEVVLILKTQTKNYDAVEKAVKSLHSYECPCICALPVTQGFKPYLDWMASESTK